LRRTEAERHKRRPEHSSTWFTGATEGMMEIKMSIGWDDSRYVTETATWSKLFCRVMIMLRIHVAIIIIIIIIYLFDQSTTLTLLKIVGWDSEATLHEWLD